MYVEIRIIPIIGSRNGKYIIKLEKLLRNYWESKCSQHQENSRYKSQQFAEASGIQVDKLLNNHKAILNSSKESVAIKICWQYVRLLGSRYKINYHSNIKEQKWMFRYINKIDSYNESAIKQTECN